MKSIFLAAVFVASAGMANQGEGEPFASDVAAHDLRACGFSSVQVVPYDFDEVQIIRISEETEVTDSQLACVAQVDVSTLQLIELPQALRERYFPIYRRLQMERDAQSSRAWLAERGLLDQAPVFTEGQDLAFAKQLEEFCGPNAKGALNSEYGPHAISPIWSIEALNSNEREPALGETLQCLLRTAAAAKFELYLLGNDKDHHHY